MPYEELVERINNDTARIVVMGLGYVGLPLATEFAKAGFHVVGYDPDESKIQAIRQGRSYVDYPTSEILKYLVDGSKLEATADPACLDQADIVFICVPTPLNKTKDPDLSLVDSAAQTVARHQHEGMLVVLESTSYPGTTRELLVPLLTKELELGQGVFIAYSPERIDPGNQRYNLTNTPKVVAGMSPNCSRLVQRIYFKINEQVVPVTSPEVAEMTKILENSFRAVNIGLVNEVALICRKLGIDPFEVIDAASTKPFGFMPFYPGPGLGGHCIPVDPLYLAWKLRALHGQARFIELADAINSGMPDHVVSVVTEALNSRSQSVREAQILVMGVTYKADVQDMRESPIIPLIQKLVHLGAEVEYEDPYVTKFDEVPDVFRVANPAYDNYDLVVIATAHQAFDYKRLLAGANLIVDTRGVLRDQYRKPLKDPKVFRI